MRKVLLTLLLFALVQTLFSQQDSVLKNFKYRIDHYQAVTIDVGAGGQYSKNDLVLGSAENSDASGNFGGSYFFNKSTDRILLNIVGSGAASFITAKAANPGVENKNNGFSSSAYFIASNKWFSKKFFTELGTNLTLFQNSSKSTSQSSPGTYKSKDFNPGASVTVGIGTGRLENVTDMQNALWLYKALKGENKLSRDLSPAELNELGRAITKANNTRILDTRRRTQFILETVDRFFQEKNLINTTDIRYFSNLNDILFYAFNYGRISGTEKFIRLTPSITHLNRDQTQDPVSKYENNLTTKAISLSAGISKYQPVNLVHQNNMGASIAATYFKHNDTEKYFTGGVLTNVFETNPTLKQAAVNLFFQHAIYPNTRTILSLGINSETGVQNVNDESNFFAKVDLTGNISYFISYRTRFTFNLGVGYYNDYHSFSPYFQLLNDNIQLMANAGFAINL